MADDPSKKQTQETGSVQSSPSQKGQQSGREQNPSQENQQGNEDNVSRKTPAPGTDIDADEEGQGNEDRQRKAS